MTNVIKLPPGDMPFLYNLSYYDIDDGFLSDRLETMWELDGYGRLLEKEETQDFKAITRFAEDNVW